MKKTYGLILSVLLGVILCPSCIYDKLDDSCDEPHVTDGKCYMSLRFNLKAQSNGSPLTRTYEPSFEDEDYERKVSDFRIFLVNRDDPDARVIEIKDIPMLDETTTEPFKIETTWTHGYLLYVVANSGDSFQPDLSSGKAFRGTYEMGTAEACAKLWEKNHFLMVNVNNEAEDMNLYKSESIDHEDKTPYGGVPLEIDLNKDYPYEHPYQVQVTLERVAAKIVVDCSKENYDFSINKYPTLKGTFSDVKIDGVALLNSAHSFNLVQKWKIAYYQGNTWKQSYEDKILPKQSETAPYGYPYLWAVTPQGDINSVPSELYHNMLSEFTDTENQTLKQGAEQLFSPLSDHTATFHCLENVSPLYLDFIKSFNKETNKIQENQLWHDAMVSCMRNRATGVIFRVRANFKPDNHSTGDLIKDPNIGEWDKASVKSSQSNDDYRTFYYYNNTVTVYLSELLNAEPTLVKKGITSSSSIKDLRNAGVNVYENGYMYYTYWIKDKNYQYLFSYLDEYDEDWPFYYYGIMRNTRYEINVSKITELGADLPCREVDDNGEVVAEGQNYMLCPIELSRYLDATIISDLKNNSL